MEDYEKLMKVEALREPTLETIYNAIKFCSGVEIKHKEKNKHRVNMRKIFFKVARSMTTCTLEQIGHFVGVRHRVVIFHLENFDDFIKDDFYRQKLIEIIELVKSSLMTVDKILSTKPTEDKDKLIYVVEIKKEVEFVEKQVNYILPEYLTHHLLEYSEEELKDVFETRLKPYKMLLDSKKR